MRVAPGASSLAILPVWHIFERSAAYFVYSRGGAGVLSSVRRFREDLAAHPPDLLARRFCSFLFL